MNKGRYVKIVKVSYTDVTKNHADDKVNNVIDIIRNNGGKIVSLTQNVFGVGMSTVYLLYNIIYEADGVLPHSVFNDNGKERKN